MSATPPPLPPRGGHSSLSRATAGLGRRGRLSSATSLRIKVRRRATDTLLVGKRRNPRHRALLDVAFNAGRLEGEGVLADLSASGAAIERATQRPVVGSQLRIEIFVEPNRTLQLRGTVSRHTETGFAVEHIGLSEELDELVKDVAAIAEGEKDPGLEV